MRRTMTWIAAHPKASGALGLLILIGAIAGASSGKQATTADSARPSGSMSIATSSSSRPTGSTTGRSAVTIAPADQPAGSQTAASLLATLAIKGRAAKSGYSRTQFGAAWTDANSDPLGRNGCDTRNDILRRDLSGISLKAGSNGCTVLAGTLIDPYTAVRIRFVRGAATSSAVQIDHVVALSDAWQKGAQQWGLATRVDLANDPLNLLAVDGPTNEAKGDGDAATWLPPNKAYRCAYVARQVSVKARYRLWVTGAEHDAIARVLATCPGQKAPDEGGAPSATTPPATTPPATMPPANPAATSTYLAPAPGDVYYPNCTAVRAAGKAPLRRGDPGYRAALDRDSDGIACE
jgi:hypothetical protein